MMFCNDAGHIGSPGNFVQEMKIAPFHKTLRALTYRKVTDQTHQRVVFIHISREGQRLSVWALTLHG